MSKLLIQLKERVANGESIKIYSAFSLQKMHMIRKNIYIDKSIFEGDMPALQFLIDNNAFDTYCPEIYFENELRKPITEVIKRKDLEMFICLSNEYDKYCDTKKITGNIHG